MAKYRVAIVVPAFNEERTIGHQINELCKIGDVIVVNDGSVDSTKDVCGRLKCLLINLPNNCGYDFAIETGIKACLDYDFVITTDADGEIPIASVRQVKQKLISGNDCVLGVRDRIPRIGERVVNLVVYKIFRLKDIFCGLKGYRVDKIAPDFELVDSVGTRLALMFMKKNERVDTVPVHIQLRDGESRFGKNDFKTNFKLLRVLKYVF